MYLHSRNPRLSIHYNVLLDDMFRTFIMRMTRTLLLTQRQYENWPQSTPGLYLMMTLI